MTSVPGINLFEQERGRLFTLAYGFLGSRAEAADAVQDAWLRWQSGSSEAVRNPAAWLTTVTARLALDRLRSARARRETYPGIWLPEPIVEGPSAEQSVLQRGELSMAFLFLLERLGPDERAALVLREVFDHSYREIAEALEKSPAACRQLVTRAREHVRQDRVRTQVDRAEFERVLQRYVEALVEGNERTLLELIAPGAVLYGDGGGKVTAVVNPVYGQDRIVRLLLGLRRKYPGHFVARATNVNGQPGLLFFSGTVLNGIAGYEIADGQIQRIFHVPNPDKLNGQTV